jgi:MoxR-like ATPase
LPEAQLDRFLLKINMSYPSPEAEKQMLTSATQHGTRYFQHKTLQPVASKEDILSCRQALNEITVTNEMLDYILQIIQDTRQNPNVELGCSPRAALSLLAASRAYAAIHGQHFVSPDHVKIITPAVIQHRLILTADAELDGIKPADAVKQILNKVPIPR